MHFFQKKTTLFISFKIWSWNMVSIVEVEVFIFSHTTVVWFCLKWVQIRPSWVNEKRVSNYNGFSNFLIKLWLESFWSLDAMGSKELWNCLHPFQFSQRTRCQICLIFCMKPSLWTRKEVKFLFFWEKFLISFHPL